MNALENKVIIYDDVCPLCDAYTGSFIKMGWLKQRTGFAGADPTLLSDIDLDRARHEIPLYDTQSRQTLYGLDALFCILGARLPVLMPVFRNRIFRSVLKQVYQIITYNRRIIAGSRAPRQGFDCAPDVNLFYRWLYIVLALVVAVVLLTVNWPGQYSSWYVALPALQAILLLLGLLLSANRLNFLGHWATISLVLAVSVGLLPLHPAAAFLWTAFGTWLWFKRWDLAFS